MGIHGFVSLGRLSLDSIKKKTEAQAPGCHWIQRKKKTKGRPLETIGFNRKNRRAASGHHWIQPKKQWMPLCSPLTLEYTYSPLTTINPTEYLACGLVPASKDPRFCFFGAAENGFHKKKQKRRLLDVIGFNEKKNESAALGNHWIQQKKRKCGLWTPLDSTKKKQWMS